jgi:glycosyltransferase involved in cell wall biosynthesis
MKILYVYRTYFPDPPGGLQEAIRQICLSVQPYGVENTIFTLSPTPDPNAVQRPEALVVRSRSWAAPASCDLGGIQAFTRFRQLADQADLIHYFFPWPFADLMQQFVRPEKPTVLTYISDIVRQKWLGRAYGPLLKRTLNSMSAIVTSSPAYAQSSPILSAPSIRDRVQVIPLGVTENSCPQVGDDTVFQRLNLDPEKPFFLFVGVLRYYKGLRFLMEAATQVPAPVVIAGSGPEESQLWDLAKNSNAANVMFAGQVTDAEKTSLLNRCYALVLPSHLRSEAYGMVLVEASMFSKPMVTCEIGTGTSWINQHGETGYVVEPANPLALSTAMNNLLADDVAANQMGLMARKRYQALYSGDTTGCLYAELYKRLLSV